MHQAKSCIDCPGTNGGESMCNGECEWDHSSNHCVEKEGKFLISIDSLS